MATGIAPNDLAETDLDIFEEMVKILERRNKNHG